MEKKKKKDFITHYLRIALGIVLFGVGITFLMYDGEGITKWWQWINYFGYMILFLGEGLYLLDVKY